MKAKSTIGKYMFKNQSAKRALMFISSFQTRKNGTTHERE